MKEEKYYKPIKGNCNICGKNYIIASTQLDEHDSFQVKYDCPQCGYNPDFERKIENLIEVNISAQINSSGKIRFNSDELAELVDKEIRRIWPKNERTK